MNRLPLRNYPAGIALLAFISLFFQQKAAAQSITVQGANTLHAYFRGKTKPLRDLAPMPATSRAKRDLKKANKPVFTPPNFINWRRQPQKNLDALPRGVDPVRQDVLARNFGVPVEPTLIIEGIDENTTEIGVPDTNGDVSSDHYIQIQNASWFQVFAKDGTALTPPTTANTIWSEIGEESFSDPVILFDEDAGRWLITDLADIDVVLYGVSETSDPMGAWYLYTLNTPGFADYPKYGVFPQAYIFTINEGNGVYPVYALNRQQMLDGDGSVDVQRMEIPGLDGGFPTATPMDWNGANPPATNEMFVVRLNDDAWGNGNPIDLLEVWTINLDWTNAANTTIASLELPTAAYDTDGCTLGGGFDYQCIPQPGTNQGIDGIMTIVMNNVVYRNFSTHESAVLCFSVDATGDNVAGIRWMELRRLPGQNWALYQEGTYDPGDGGHRFIPSISINSKGDIGLAYSISGENNFPSLRFTGRREGDALGEMSVDEYEFAAGTGVRDSDRFGDYSHMSVDPTDDSFWFTGEYVKEDGSFGTKIVQFSLRKDTFDIAPTALDAPQDSPDLTATESVTIKVRNLGLEPANNFTVGFIFNNGVPVVEPANLALPLLPDSIYTHTFAATADLSAVGAYDFKVFTTFADDQNVQNDTLRKVRRKLPRFDAGITGVGGLDQALCDSSSLVVLNLTNFGTETLTFVTFQYQVNGGAAQTQDWTGSLPTGESVSADLLLDGLISGTNTLTVSTLNPNGMADEIPSNDSYSRDFQVILGGIPVTLTLMFDFYPEETSWQVQDENGTIIFVGSHYDGLNQETINVEWCLLEDKCYTFIIFDSYGDGLMSFGPDGSYQITGPDGNVLASILQVDFGEEEQNPFCVTTCAALAADFDVTPAATSGSNDGVILITVTGGASPFQYSKNGGLSFQSSPMFSNLDAGTYNIVVEASNGCLIEFQVTVAATVAAADLKKDYRITVSPNPSANGAFWLKVEGMSGAPLLDLDVVDETGRAILHEKLTAVDDYHKGLVSLRAFPAGVYYIRFKNEKISELIRVVRM